MEFRNLKKQYEVYKREIDAAVGKVLQDANFISGSQVSELEAELAEYAGVKHCITCANGTDALQLALMAWEIGPGDAVFVPDFTFFSSGEVVPAVGAVPVFVDVEKDTYNIDPLKLEEAIRKVLEEGKWTPKVIVAVDLFGQPADYPAIREIADRYQLFILEDAAQGFGGRIGNKRACSFGDIATTSFFPAKPLGCYGDGGAVFTDDDQWAELLRSYRIHGKGRDKYDNVRIGMNSRLDTLQAAILQVKLKHFEDEIGAANQVAAYYQKALAEAEQIEVPVVKEGYTSSWAQYTIKLPAQKRDMICSLLKEKGIPAMIYYLKPMHCQKAFGDMERLALDYSVTDDICNRVLSLPMGPFGMEDAKQTAGILADICNC
ncbi:MAG: DegT/DnrJ/EryC1/StrS family aminotransferase [Lachnospiraceae bacterium]|nr:DegT/DnrJ/EryC1/StrS family aminotransferase [Lachnospiraceae bacterium]